MLIYDEEADLYDLVFSWDVTKEVDWLISRLGRDVSVILEPACGSGRFIPPFAERGVRVIGVDASRAMIQRAHARSRKYGLSEPQIVEADMAAFSIGQEVDGAFCAINSIRYLPSVDAMARHLECVANSLKSGGKYMVQMDLQDCPQSGPKLETPCCWESEAHGIRVRTEWRVESYDASTGLETQVCTMDLLQGPGAGRRVESRHVQRRWSFEAWAAIVEASRFMWDGCFEGESAEYRTLPIDDRLDGQQLLWHELSLTA